MDTHKPIIALDGTAASGKGTLAKKIAQIYGFAHLDTGLLYRYGGVEGVRAGVDIDDPRAAAEFMRGLAARLVPETLDDPAYRAADAGEAASRIAKHQGVRDQLVELQRNFAKNPPPLPGGDPAAGAVLDGRDIGTVICPQADVKIFVDARVEIRAERRFKELQSVDNSVTYEAVLADMQTRDRRDRERETAPLKPADDAVLLDTSDLDVGQMLAKACSIIAQKITRQS